MLDLELHALAQVLVERAERLVHQHQLGIEHERAGERDALLLAAGELLRVAVAEGLELHHAERALHPRLDLVRRQLAHAQREAQVVGHRHVRKQRIVLEHHADVAAVGRHPVDDLAVEADLAAGGRLEAGEHHQAGGLARTGRPEQGEELAAANVEIQVPHDEGFAVVGLLDVAKADVGCLAVVDRFHLSPSPARGAVRSGDRILGHELAQA